MQRRTYISLFGAALLTGCTSENDDPDGTADPVDGEPTDSGSGDGGNPTGSESEKTEIEPGTTAGSGDSQSTGPITPQTHEFARSGDATIEGVELADHLTIVEGSHNGDGTFLASIRSDGQAATLLSQEGAWGGEVAHAQGEGVYTLVVTADGEWSLTLRQPQPESGDPVPPTLSGSGNTVSGPFAFENEEFTVSATYSGDAPLLVHVIGVDGQMQLIDGVEFVEEVEYGSAVDVGWVAVEGDGDWTLTFE